MLPVERQKKIMDLLKVKKVLKLSELTEKLDISIETLRRDLNLLAKQGKIEKIYGGVKMVETAFGESEMSERMAGHIEEKRKIGQVCSEFINDGDCIFIDSGSTTFQIANYIKNKKNITVITNSIPVISELLNSDIEIIIIGGKVRHSEQSVVAYDYIFNFSELNIVKAFICAGGITIEKGISDYNLEEAITRKKIIEIAKEIYVAADSTKFGKDVTVSITQLDKVDYIITDHNLVKSWVNEFEKTNTNLIISE